MTKTVEPLADAVVAARSQGEVENALTAACDAVCGLFAAETTDVDRWLDGACGQVLRVARAGLEEDERGSLAGVWASLIEGDPWAEKRRPNIGVCGFADDIEREEVCEQVMTDLSAPLARMRSVRRRVAAEAGSKTGETGMESFAERVGSFALVIGDEHGVESLLCVGVMGNDGRPHGAAGQSSAVRGVCRAMARAAEERIIRPRSRHRRLTGQLSQAQQQVLELLIEGITEHEIASRLGRSRHTVHDHVRSIYKTLGMSSRAELIAVWNEAGRR